MEKDAGKKALAKMAVGSKIKKDKIHFHIGNLEDVLFATQHTA